MLTLECKEGLSYYPGKPHKTQTLEVVCQGELDTGLARFVKKNSTSPLPYCQKECYSNGDCHPNFSMCSNGKFICLNLMFFWYNVVWQTVISGLCVKNCHHQGTEYTPGQSVTFACPDGTLIEGSESKHEIISCKEVTGGTQFCDSKGVCQIPKCAPGKL